MNLAVRHAVALPIAGLISLLAMPAIAAEASAPAATWSPGPLYLALQPYVLTAFGIVFTALFGWACALFQKHTGIVVSENARQAVQTAAENAAGRIYAAGDAKVASIQIPVSSPLVQAEIPVVTAAVKSSVDQLGMTPERVGALIQGKIGLLQAQAQNVLPTDGSKDGAGK